MSLTSLRWAALGLGVVAFGLRLVAKFWVEPLTWDLDFGPAMLIFLGGFVVGIGVPMAIWVLLARRAPAAALLPGDGRLTVPASVASAAPQAIMLLFLAGGLVLTEREGDSIVLADRPFAWFAGAVAVALFVGATLLWLAPRPWLELDPAGLTIHRMLGRTRVAWDELAHGGPHEPSKWERQLVLCRNANAIDAGLRPTERIPIWRLHADRAQLADAIRRYAEHPEDRATIGTPT